MTVCKHACSQALTGWGLRSTAAPGVRCACPFFWFRCSARLQSPPRRSWGGSDGSAAWETGAWRKPLSEESHTTFDIVILFTTFAGESKWENHRLFELKKTKQKTEMIVGNAFPDKQELKANVTVRREQIKCVAGELEDIKTRCLWCRLTTDN